MKKRMLSLLMLAAPAVWASPETFVIDSKHTLPRFEYNHLGYSTQTSRFDNTTGKIVIDRKAKIGSVDVVIDTKSVSTGSALFNEHIQGEDYLDTAKYPQITFKSDKLKFDGEKLVAVDGQLTIKGVTKPVTLTISAFHCMPHPMLKKEACGADARTQIKRSEFNAGKHAPYVSDEVSLIIPVEAVKE